MYALNFFVLFHTFFLSLSNLLFLCLSKIVIGLSIAILFFAVMCYHSFKCSIAVWCCSFSLYFLSISLESKQNKDTKFTRTNKEFSTKSRQREKVHLNLVVPIICTFCKHIKQKQPINGVMIVYKKIWLQWGLSSKKKGGNALPSTIDILSLDNLIKYLPNNTY